jgi:exopolysaccharide production protein ExoQ
MLPSLALLASFLLVMVFLRWSKDPEDSLALWLPVIWLFLVSSRLPSIWLGVTTATSAVAASEEGNALDRTVYLALLATALWVLARRRINWSEFLARNSVLVLFVAFTLLSVAWSDYLYVSFKRWVRDLNPYAMAIVVLSEPSPLMAISAVIRRVSYIVLPLSLLLIKYYPGMGIVYDEWTGRPMAVGVATGKNTLGLICLVAILFFFWDTLGRWPERKSPTEKLILVANVTSIAIAWRLFMFVDSATARGCLIIGCVIILVVRSKWARANRRLFTMVIPAVIIGYILLESVFDLSAMVAGLLGRDPTLTGRTETWKVLLQMQTNPLIGLGYGSLWTGDRMASIMRSLNTSYLNETHNGYLDIYLTLGFVGLVLCVGFLLSSYRKICRQIVVSPHYAAFAVSFWVVAVLYNVTETAVSGTLVWSVLLFFTIVVPRTEHARGLPGSPRIMSRRTAIGDRRA